MEAIKSVYSNMPPPAIEVWYNGELAADSTTLRYTGSIVKLMNHGDIDNGVFATFGGLTTIGERVFGILGEAQPTTGNYLPNDATYGPVYRKVVPCPPAVIVQAEYAQNDRAGTSNLDTGATGSAGSTTFTTASISANDEMIGGWIYFTNGSNQNYLHYVTDSAAAGNTLTLATALNNAVVATDDWVCILPPMARKCLFDDTYTGIKSEVDDGSWTHSIMGLSTWIKAPGIPMQKLSRDNHDGLSIANARFYHQFTFCGQLDENADTKPNAWVGVNLG
jgi:hypothetical protein